MADEKNRIYVHCKAGKGRTGSLISCFLLYSRFADCAENSILYYGIKRFVKGIGINQPS